MQRVIDDMDALYAETCEMANLAKDMLERSIQAITDGDEELADTIIADQERIERYDDDIESAACRILTLYQPTAMDARMTAAILKSITYLERIAKYSTNVANAVKYLKNKPSFEVVDLIAPAGEAALALVNLAVGGFEKRDISGFDRFPAMDDVLDTKMQEGLMRVVGFINEHENSADVCTYYISALKFYERVGDHACKMGEKVYYMVTGEVADIN